MEVVLLSLSFYFLSFLSYVLDKKLVNPVFTTTFLWANFLLLYQISPHSLYPLGDQFLFGISLWVFSFFFGGMFFLRSKIQIDTDVYNPKIFAIYYYAVLIFAPLALASLIMEAAKSGFEYFFLRLRIINTGLEEDDTYSLGALGYVFNFANVVCILYTFYYERVSKFRYYMILFLTILLGMITLARTSLMVLLLAIFIIMYFKSALRRKHYLMFSAIILIFLAVISFLRSFHETDASNSIADTIAIYLFAGMPAFDTLRYIPSEATGEYALRFFYAVGRALGLVGSEAKSTILEYAYVPTPTNVYTVMFPFYKDFGNLGILIFGGIYGALFSFVYALSKNRIPVFIMLYAFFFPCLILQFMGEFIFQNLSTYLQILIFLLIPKFLKIK